MGFTGWLFLVGALSSAATVLVIALANSFAARKSLQPSPLQKEFARLSQGFRFVAMCSKDPPTPELCEVMRLLQGKCAAITGGLRRDPEVIVESDQNDDEPNGTSAFPWEDVDAARTDLSLQRRFNPDATIRDFGAKAICRECSGAGNMLTWCYFISPDWTWEHLCGRAGWLAICDDCRRQVLFICDALN